LDPRETSLQSEYQINMQTMKTLIAQTYWLIVPILLSTYSANLIAETPQEQSKNIQKLKSTKINQSIDSTGNLTI
jgi:hypothetical protein